MIQLSLKLGIPVSELGDRLSAEDFMLYIAYFSIVPIEADAYYFSQLMWSQAQVHSKKTLKSKDFHPDWFGDLARTAQQTAMNPSILLGKIAAAGGKIIRK